MINVKNVVIKKDQTGNAYEQLEKLRERLCARILCCGIYTGVQRKTDLPALGSY